MSDEPQQFALPFLAQPSRSPLTSILRVMTWNVQHACPARARRQAAWLAVHDDADVLILTEVRHAPGGWALAQSLREYGYHVIVPKPTGSDYMVVVAARRGVLQEVPRQLGYLSHRLVAARLELGVHRIGIVGLYVPSRGPQSRRNQDKRAFQEAVSAYLPPLAADLGGGMILVAGDLNVVEPGHQPHYPVFGDWEYRFYTRFAECGFVDAFRALHPDAAQHSWFGRGGNGYRLDHIFVSGQHRRLLQACCYVHQPRLAGLSDHAPMSAILMLRDPHVAPGNRP